MNNAAAWLMKKAILWSNKVAIVSGDKKITYKELFSLAHTFAKQAKNAGLSKGDRVILYGKNSLEMATAILGVLTFGGVVVCLHPKLSLKTVQYILNNSSAKGFVTDRPLELSVSFSSVPFKLCFDKNIKSGWAFWDDLLKDPSGIFLSQEVEDVTPEDLAALIYTSGSTGKPKGVMSSHANIIFSTDAINAFLKHNPDDKVLSYLPLAFDYGLYQLFLTLSSGAALYLRDAEDYISDMTDKLIEKEGITGFPGLRSLFSFFTTVKHTPQTTVRYMTNTGDTLPKGMVERLAYTFPNAKTYLMYGLTECKRVSYLPPEYLQSKPNSVGIPLRNTRISIKNEKNMECESNEIGELYVQGAHVCQGYWKDETTTAATFISDSGTRWLKTGDLFYRDHKGFLYYVARKDHLFKCSGFRVDPVEIENEILEHFSAVSEVVVVGIPDKMLGHAVGLYIVPDRDAVGELTENKLMQQIKSFCKLQLEYWKQPKYILMGSFVPLTNTQKIDRAKICQLLMDRLKK